MARPRRQPGQPATETGSVPVDAEIVKAEPRPDQSALAEVRYHQSRLDRSPAILEAQWQALLKVSKGLLDAGAFPENVKTENQGALILLISWELGIPYTAGMRMVDIIYNRPALRGQLVGGLLRSKGCQVNYLHSDETKCRVQIIRPDGGQVTNEVTLAEVGKLRTMEKGQSISLADKSNWKQQPKVMLQRFTVKQTANMFCEDMILGLYTEDELEVMEPGKAIDVTPRPEPAAQEHAPARGLPAPAAPAGDLGRAFQERVTGAAPVPAIREQPAPVPTGKALNPDTFI